MADSIEKLIGIIDNRVEKVIDNKSNSFVKQKIGQVTAYDKDSFNAYVVFPDDIEQKQHTYYNKSGEALDEGDFVRVLYTVNIDRGWITAKTGITDMLDIAADKSPQFSISPLISYDYLSNTSVRMNGVTYTIEKNDTGLISKILDSDGREFEPNIIGNITDTTLHNAIIWATAINRGIVDKIVDDFVMPFMDGIVGYFIPETRNINQKRWDNFISEIPSDINANGYISFNNISQKGFAVHLGIGEYGKYTVTNVENPALSPIRTVYCIFRTQNPYTNNTFFPIITKHMSIGGAYANGMGFNLLSYDTTEKSHATFSDINKKDIISDFSTEEYNICSYSRISYPAVPRDDNYFYVNGNLIGTGGLGGWKNYYGGAFLLNTALIDETEASASINAIGNTDIIMCAFGTIEHTQQEMVENYRWLANKMKTSWKD